METGSPGPSGMSSQEPCTNAMPNLNQILREEIVRLAKREINQQVGALKGQLVEMRKTAREQRRRIEQLERELAGNKIYSK